MKLKFMARRKILICLLFLKKIIDVEYTIEQSKELVSANDNKFPTLPTDPQALPSYIVFADKVLVAETKLLKRINHES